MNVVKRCRPRRGLVHLGACALGVFMAAGGTAQAHSGETENAKRVELNVHGRIAEYCALGAIEDVDFGDLTRPNLSRKIAVPLSCNMPFRMTIRSAQGGLANETMPQGQGPYAGTLPYRVDVSVPVRLPRSATVRGSFSSRELVGTSVLSSDGGIALDGMELNVMLGTPASDVGLLAGNYSETIVITVAPS